MSDLRVLGQPSIDLLLSLLEAEEPVITGSAAELMHHAASPLIAAHLLVGAGYDDVVGIQDGDHEEMIAVFPIREDGTLGHADPHNGFAAVPHERLLRHRVDIGAMLRLMMRDMDLPTGWTATPLIDGMLWEVANVRLDPTSVRQSIWFARRLIHADNVIRLEELVERRPAAGSRLILTSTAISRLASGISVDAILVPLRDVLRSFDSLVIDPAIVERRLRRIGPDRDTDASVWLSQDGRILRFRDGAEFRFSGGAQIAALKMLHDAFRRQHGVPTKVLTQHRSLQNLFGAKRWMSLKQYFERRADGWAFRG